MAKVKLDFLIDNDMLLMVDNVIRGGIYHAIHRYRNDNNKLSLKKKNHVKYWDVSILHG